MKNPRHFNNPMPEGRTVLIHVEWDTPDLDHYVKSLGRGELHGFEQLGVRPKSAADTEFKAAMALWHDWAPLAGSKLYRRIR